MFKFIIKFLLISNFLQFAYSAGDVPKSNPPGQIDQNQGQTRHRNLLPLPDQLPVLNSAQNATNLSHHTSGENFMDMDTFEIPIPSAVVADEDASASFAFPSLPMSSSSLSLIDSKGKGKEVIQIGDEDEQRIAENMPPSHSPNQAEQVDPALEPYQKEIFRLAAQIDELEKNLESANNLHSIWAPNALKNSELYGYRPDLESEYVVKAYELQLPFLKQMLPLKRNIARIFGKMIAMFPSNPQLAAWENQRSFMNGDAATLSRKINDREKFCENYRHIQNNQRGRPQHEQATIAIHQAEAQEGHQHINHTLLNAPSINIHNNPPNQQQIQLHQRQMAAALIAQQHHQRHQPMHGPLEQQMGQSSAPTMPNQRMASIPGMHSNMGGDGGSSSGDIIHQMQHSEHQGHQIPTRLPLPTATVDAMHMQHQRLETGGAVMSIRVQSQQHLQRQNLQHIPMEILRAEMARRESQMQNSGGNSKMENIVGGSSGNSAAQFRLPPSTNIHQQQHDHHFKQFSPFHHMQQQIHQMPSVDVQWNQLHSFAHPQQNLSNNPSGGDGSDGQQGPSAEHSNFHEMAEGSNGNKRLHEEVGDGEDDEGNKRMRPPYV